MRFRILFLFVFLLSSVIYAAEKDLAFPKDLPALGELNAVPAPDVNEKKLANGVTLWLAPQPGFPKVAIMVVVKSGRADDRPDLAGISDVFAAMLNQGTKTKTAQGIAEDLQKAGGEFTYWVYADGISFGTVVLSEMASSAADILSDIAKNATFPKNEYETIKKQTLEFLQAHEAEPSFLAERSSMNLLFGNHPYAIISGAENSLSKISREQVQEEYASRFLPDQTLVIAAGDFESKSMENLLTNLFGNWNGSRKKNSTSLQNPIAKNTGDVFLLNRPGSVQSTLLFTALGPKRGDADYAEAEVANTILGGMSSGRLFANIREDKGYAYSTWSSINAQNMAGIYTVKANVRNEVTGAAFNEMLYEFNRMATTTPLKEEVVRAQRYLLGLRAFWLQSSRDIAYELASIWLNGQDQKTMNRETKQILAVTPEDVKRVANSSNRYVAVVVGDEKVIRS